VNVAGLHCRVEGPSDAPPLVLANSLGTDLHLWDPQAAALSSRFRRVRYDGRGHGRSEAPPGPYSIDQLGGDLLAVLDGLDVGRAHLCGLSMGGLISLWLAARHPDRVDRLVLVSSASRIGTEERWEARVQAVRNGGMEAVVDTVVDSIFLTEAFRRRDPATTRRVADVLLSTPVDGYVGSCLALRDADLGPLVPQVRAPSLIVAGRHDVSTPPEDAESLRDRLPGSRLVVLDAAHLCNIEQPEAFTDAVVEFLTSERRPARRGGEDG
jgi:3-oxoadipate enol-lactonase